MLQVYSGLLWQTALGPQGICHAIPGTTPGTQCLSVSSSFWSRRFRSWLVPLSYPGYQRCCSMEENKHGAASREAHSRSMGSREHLQGEPSSPPGVLHGTASGGGEFCLLSMSSLWTCLWLIKSQLCLGGCRRHLGRRWQRPSVNSAK